MWNVLDEMVVGGSRGGRIEIDAGMMDVIADGVDSTKEVNNDAIDSKDNWAASVEKERPVKAGKFVGSKSIVEGEAKERNGWHIYWIRLRGV